MTRIAAVLVALVLAPPAAAGDLPPGWFHAGDRPDEYESGVEAVAGRAGRTAFIRGRSSSPGGFGTLMQNIASDDYRGRRVRFSAEVKTAGVAQWAGLWMRVDGASGVLAFDNMNQRPIKGHRDWARYDVVLDVPAGAQGIAFGLLLTGAGQAWMSGLRLEAVGEGVPTTDALALPKRPNLSFER